MRCTKDCIQALFPVQQLCPQKLHLKPGKVLCGWWWWWRGAPPPSLLLVLPHPITKFIIIPNGPVPLCGDLCVPRVRKKPRVCRVGK